MKFTPKMDDDARTKQYWRTRGLSVRVATALTYAGIRSVQQLRRMDDNQILQVKHIGLKALHELYAEGCLWRPNSFLNMSRVNRASLLAQAVAAHARWLGAETGGPYEDAYRREMEDIQEAFTQQFGRPYTDFIGETE